MSAEYIFINYGANVRLISKKIDFSDNLLKFKINAACDKKSQSMPKHFE